MKRLKFHRAIVAIAMMLIGWLPSLAHDFEINGVFYNVISTTEVEVTYKGSYDNEFDNEYNGSVVIPSLVEYGGFYYSVTSIGDYAFLLCESLTSIEIPNSVTSIGEGAFYKCSGLTSIEIPNSVTSIGDWAFFVCYSLTSIEIPNSVRSIGDYAFNECKGLTSVVIGNSVTSIGDRVFGECDSLTSIVVDAGNSKYDSRNGCNAIIETASNTLIVGCQNTIIPNNVTSIGDYAFDECTSLTSIEIPNSVTSIGYGAFAYCESLTSIQIPDSVTSIGEWAFVYCSSLTSIEIGNSVTSIGYDAFAYCSSLTSIQIPNSVTSIGDDAFYGCDSLTSIEIGNSVTSIGYAAFSDCDSLTSIVVDAGNTKYDSRNECNAIIETASNTLIAGCKNTIIPNSVTSIGRSAFHGCTSLTSIEIPNSVTSIGDSAFLWCDSLTEIKCWATTPPTIESYTFSDYSADLYVPVGCKSAYQSANYWKNFNIINDTLDAPVTLKDNDAIVATIGDNIVVKNATAGSVVRVYTADGAMIATGVATEGDVIIEAPAKGIYIVKVGKQTVKVII